MFFRILITSLKRSLADFLEDVFARVKIRTERISSSGFLLLSTPTVLRATLLDPRRLELISNNERDLDFEDSTAAAVDDEDDEDDGEGEEMLEVLPVPFGSVLLAMI